MRVLIDRYRKDGKKRKERVHIDGFDIWNLDHTLALIIYPALKMMRKDTHGAGNTDDADVPEELRSTNAVPKKNEWDTDSNFFKRWHYILDEMIWAFGELASDEKSFDWKKYGYLSQEYKDYNARIENGLRLFGRYYRGLWT